MDREWFSMDDLKRRTFNNKVWIPLEAQKKLTEAGDHRSAGFVEEFFAAHSLIVPVDNMEEALALRWMDFHGGFGDRPWRNDDGTLHRSDDFELPNGRGMKPVLRQYVEIDHSREWHLHQDLVLALGLKREQDVWICPEEDFIEVVRLERNSEGHPTLIEIRAEFLKDYLKAAGAGLILLTFQSRHEVQPDFEHLDWGSGTEEAATDYRWTGHLMDTYSDSPFGGPVHVIQAGRKNVDYSEDVPKYEFPGDEDTWSKSFVVEPKGQKLIRAMAEIWKQEWIRASAVSPRVAGDNVPSTLEFIVDNEGRKETSDTLRDPSRWLWFHPDVVNDLLRKRTAVLEWYTEDTGGVGGAWHRKLHFGVNPLGLVNVYAKDIANVDEIDKKVWFRHNVAPEGGVSPELHSVQMATILPDTMAPEESFVKAMDALDTLFNDRFGAPLFRRHSEEQNIIRHVHRFKASSLEGFYVLCKEVTRIFTERIDVGMLQSIHPEAEKLGSLKRLERILSKLGLDGRTILGPMVGVYELRLADAHLPSASKITEAMTLIGVNYEQSGHVAGKLLLKRVDDAITALGSGIYLGELTKLADG